MSEEADMVRDHGQMHKRDVDIYERLSLHRASFGLDEDEHDQRIKRVIAEATDLPWPVDSVSGEAKSMWRRGMLRKGTVPLIEVGRDYFHAATYVAKRHGGHLSTEALTMCGLLLEDHDSWMASGHGWAANVDCPACRARLRREWGHG